MKAFGWMKSSELPKCRQDTGKARHVPSGVWKPMSGDRLMV